MGATRLERLVPAIEIEIAIAAAENEAAASNPADACDLLFRLRMRRWAMAEGDLAGLVPVRDPRLRVLEFDYDVTDFMKVRTVADFPASATRRRSHIVAFAGSDGGRQNPLVVDGMTAQILKLSDGTRTALEIARELDRQGGRSTGANNLEWIEGLLVHGLISLRDTRVDSAFDALASGTASHRDIHPRPSRRPLVQGSTNRR
jgi:hypothetical protein